MSGKTPSTEIVRASELQTKVVQRIYEARYPGGMKDYRAELRKYERRAAGKKKWEQKDRFSGTSKVYFKVEAYDQEIEVVRPTKPEPLAYAHSSYSRSSFMGQSDSIHARDYGLLSSPAFNRTIRHQRVEEYAAEIQAGNWQDLPSDPIAITTDGNVLNGQHRIAAATRVDWDKVENDPLFLVVWGANPAEALFADGSRRTTKDEKTIATKVAQSVCEAV